MVMISTIKIVDFTTKAVSDEAEIEVAAPVLGAPCIVGNFLYYEGRIKLINPTGETLVIASPITVDGDQLVHLAFGTEQRRICHNMKADDFERVVSHLNTALALARLEGKRP